MSELSIISVSCSLCNKTLEGKKCDWETYKKNIAEYMKYSIGFQCNHCNSSYCLTGHKKALQFNLWSGYEKSLCPRCGTPLRAGIVLLRTVQAKPESVPSSIREPVFFENMLKRDLAKHKMRTKMFLIIAGFSTIFVFTFSIILGLLNQKFDSTSPVFAGLAVILGIAGLGVYTWPFWLYHLIRRTKVRKWVIELPAPGEAQLEYAIHWYENQHWVRLQSEEKDEGKIIMQKKKRFNIFLGLFFMLFGLIGYFIYLGELKKPGPKIELSLTKAGFVKIV